MLKIKSKKIFFSLSIVKIIIILIFFLFLFLVGGFYFNKDITRILYPIYKIIPLPIAQIDNSNFITSAELFQNLDAVKKFYESTDNSQKNNRIDFTTRQGKIRLKIKERMILNKLIEDIIIEDFAKSKGIRITAQDINSALKESLQKNNSDYHSLSNSLQLRYNWSINNFKNIIIKRQLYTQKLFEWFVNDFKDNNTYKQAKKIQQVFKTNEGSFENTTTDFSKENLNWLNEKQIIPEVAESLKKMTPGEISDVIISPLGMHIVFLENIKINKETKEVKYKLKQIFIKNNNFIDWIQNIKSEAKISIFLRDYKWDKNKAEVIFKEKKWQILEKKIKKQSEGDPSI